MTSIQESGRSPQLQLPRGSPSNSITKSPSQLSTACLVGANSSPSPSRKRAHPNYLKIDDAVPPNKKLNTPTVSTLYILGSGPRSHCDSLALLSYKLAASIVNACIIT